MTNQEIQNKCKEYKEMKRIADEAQTAADSIADELKREMTEASEEIKICGEYKLTYTETTRRDIDKKKLAEEHEALYNAYIKETTYKRFSVL